MIGVLSPGILKIARLADFFGEPVAACGCLRSPASVRAIAGWGLRPTARKAQAYARSHQLPYFALEDGFLRSVGLGNQDAPCSLVLDDQGIYYDATRPSRLESLIGRSIGDEEIKRACALSAAWRAGRISKYNHLRDYAGALPAKYVLVVDQTFGDASVQYGLAGPEQFQRMLQAALDENPGCTVVVKIHPDVFAGRKRGHFDAAALARMERVRVLAEDAHPVRLIEKARAIYVVTSQMGFEGLLWGKPVRTFGMPFYAGWGLTRDELPAPERRGRATLEQLVHGALVDYPRYIDPETGKRCEVERLIEWMALQRRMRERLPPVVHALGFSRWKKPIVRDFLQGSEVHFVRSADEVPVGGTLAVWGRKEGAEGKRTDLQVLRLEDGFLRSVGLGADLVRPLSWVADGRGIYYDGTAASDLERLLEETTFDADLLARARRLRLRVVEAHLTKYNVGVRGWSRPAGAARVILVPGQVETDASIRYGAAEVRTNMAVLKAVRRANSDAWIVYKPHPDVLAGLRGKGAGEDRALSWCNEVVTDASMGEMLPQVDEVHVLTSLAGFEALMRGKAVTCYGTPFYAGWGLTADMATVARRNRRLALEELVAVALILYPIYVSRTTGRYTTPERALDELLTWREQGPTGLPGWRKALRWMLQRWARARGM